MTVLGPGTLTIGEIGAPIDVSCLVNGCVLSADKDSADDTTKLCGTVVPGAVTYTAKLAGNIDVDTDAGAAGLFAMSWAEPGSQHPFTFTPNSDEGTAAAGTLILDPLDFGADEFGDPLASDFEFGVVGDVTFTYGTGGATAVFQTGVPIARAPIPFRGRAPVKQGKRSKADA